MLQGPLENDLVVYVALIAESQRYEIQMGGMFFWQRGKGVDCFRLIILYMVVEISFIDPWQGFQDVTDVTLSVRATFFSFLKTILF